MRAARAIPLLVLAICVSLVHATIYSPIARQQEGSSLWRVASANLNLASLSRCHRCLYTAAAISASEYIFCRSIPFSACFFFVFCSYRGTFERPMLIGKIALPLVRSAAGSKCITRARTASFIVASLRSESTVCDSFYDFRETGCGIG